ncbi:hypothetical protein DWV06_15540 [Anaerosacchariphilus polymeriproducens]|uniref:Uncharacterized protein n=1 Tax=Anaerosacchariphilus polymeriproducens TaxID=1812858 RepID=A0A371AQV4_9FIRM|nr:hypothetical protein DWV06_15540 [Anaerosacchariphilus polymeriproducens]
MDIAVRFIFTYIISRIARGIIEDNTSLFTGNFIQNFFFDLLIFAITYVIVSLIQGAIKKLNKDK